MRYLLAPLRFPDWILGQWSQRTHYKISFNVVTSACCYRKLTAVMKKETNMVNCFFIYQQLTLEFRLRPVLVGRITEVEKKDSRFDWCLRYVHTKFCVSRSYRSVWRLMA